MENFDYTFWAVVLSSIVGWGIVILKEVIPFFIKRSVIQADEQKIKGREDLKKLRLLLCDYSIVTTPFILTAMKYFSQVKDSFGNIDPKIETQFNEHKNKYENVRRGLIELKPDLQKKYRERLDNLTVDVFKLEIFAAKGEQFVDNLKRMTKEDFRQALANITKNCSDFISDIDKEIFV